MGNNGCWCLSEYGKWTNIPNRASRHHAMRASRWAGVSFAWESGLGLGG
jgi:hypothetical protein